ncbi:hypothetical protein Kpol_1045p5 [Vanderwaltozyma polyspora DSM 70294]|uniref:Uncharacterized protein n=1 Tax=Vanderwaltozyma polyspora (strain ATCC 22028 / DSM 70294 / BCRC 21397 / CBS 2163 / NBRC 10782 / NRRL Y-8283 / UCD 57-17) TaxID=436907 RepID=A7TI14_VANPO|nr:uncharacterized protein Kpol_1045p5 [Vanderwaltozyma polyspora DSM 70294]EDO18021.1 hypothetical protein Kpol_1045p5 [Vanderwaltozyma polyspora DSM 70294]
MSVENTGTFIEEKPLTTPGNDENANDSTSEEKVLTVFDVATEIETSLKELQDKLVENNEHFNKTVMAMEKKLSQMEK